MNGISDSVALVTGAGSGIGRATAERFAREGASVLVTDIDTDAGEETVERIEDAGGDATFAEADVSDPSAVEAMVERAVEEYGSLDFAVNNAATGAAPAPVTDITEAEWDRVTEIAQKGTWLGLKHEVPAILDSGGGAIVNVASTAGIRASPGRTPYGASKHGVVGLTRTVGIEYAAENLRVNAVCPTIVETAALESMTPEEREAVVDDVPMDRPAEPAEIASAIVWLCSADASFVTAHALPVDGGETQG
jgi:NAD(P)-dependent dehydrogenase (short-subunit alcohol dehydrogenase family)